VAVIWYVAIGWLSGWERPNRAVLAALIGGAIFPDLIDKPLAWELGVLASGRSLMHSLFSVAIVSALVLVLADQYGRRDEGVAFGLAYVSHPFADTYRTLLADGTTSFLLWPLGPWPVWTGGVAIPIGPRAVEWVFIGTALAIGVVQGARTVHDGIPPIKK
jgi:membrane-bound metal-dependent hydrolase YbcI (DUF457 family)